jgi:hypothetical protein
VVQSNLLRRIRHFPGVLFIRRLFGIHYALGTHSTTTTGVRTLLFKLVNLPIAIEQSVDTLGSSLSSVKPIHILPIFVRKAYVGVQKADDGRY